MPTYPWKLVHWPNVFFLGSTLLLTLTAAPAYIILNGLGWFQAILFLVFFGLTGLSITLGYHRLFSHLSFKAGWPVRLVTLLFGAAAFENSALLWAADHRRHHKFTDDHNDPYDISKGFFHAHIGWIMFRLPPETSLEFVRDLQRDKLVMLQHRYYRTIAIFMGFILPTLIGWLVGGWMTALGSLLIAGVARVVFVHHMTFFINSLCHTLGRQPYSSRCTARDSGFMALFTFGEGYHNFHHEFQHDYRNGVKAWQFDPTKWSIWILHKLGLAHQLRRVPEEGILLAEAAEQQRQIASRLNQKPVPRTDPIHARLETAHERLQQAAKHWEQRREEYYRASQMKLQASREMLARMRCELREAAARFRAALEHWEDTRRLALTRFA